MKTTSPSLDRVIYDDGEDQFTLRNVINVGLGITSFIGLVIILCMVL